MDAFSRLPPDRQKQLLRDVVTSERDQERTRAAEEGTRIRIRRDPDDERFLVVTIRHLSPPDPPPEVLSLDVSGQRAIQEILAYANGIIAGAEVRDTIASDADDKDEDG